MANPGLNINMKAVEDRATNSCEPDDQLDSLDNAWRGVADKAATLLARFSTALTTDDILTSTASERSTLLSAAPQVQKQLSQELDDDPVSAAAASPPPPLGPPRKPTTPRITSGATRTAAELAAGRAGSNHTNPSKPANDVQGAKSPVTTQPRTSALLPQLGLSRDESKSWKRPDHAVYRKAQVIDELYDVGNEIGRGGFSIVRKGRDRQTGQVYALKMVSLRVFRKHQDLIETEVHVLASVHHPKLVGLREIVRTRTHLVLVMEFIKGGELFDLLVDLKAFSEQTAKDVFFQLLEAVDALHKNGVIHRDLKPENILVEHKPHPEDPNPKLDIKLTDFGLAVVYDPMHPNRESAGTVEYSAPEVVNKQPYDFSCDLWSLGVILYIMLTGYPPFYGETDKEVMAMVKTGHCDYTPRAWGQVSREARQVAQGLLKKNPADRMTIAQLRAHPWLAEYALGGPTPAVPQRPSLPLAQTSRLLARFNATRKLRKAVFAVLVAQRFVDKMGDRMGSCDSDEAQMFSSRLVEKLRLPATATTNQGTFSVPNSKNPVAATRQTAANPQPQGFEVPAPKQPTASNNGTMAADSHAPKITSPEAVAAALLASAPSLSSLSSSNQSKPTFKAEEPVNTAAAMAAMQRRMSWRLPDHAVFRRVKNIEELYEVREKLGEGAFSTVHRAICRETHNEFALKVIRYRVFKLHQELMENEIEILAGVCHPRLVGMHELVRTETQYVIVAELVRGGELFDRITKLKKLSEDVARTVMHQLLEAVEVLHSHGIVHRDLKPENILLASDAPLSSHADISLKLADFGLSVFYDPNSSIPGAGTPEYSAPEVIRSDHHDFSCDIWSIGVILYLMLCGFPPFTGTSSAEVMRKVKAGVPGFPSPHWDQISPEAKHLVTKLLQKNPRMRPSISQIREHIWMSKFHTDNNSAPHLPQAADALRKFNATKHFRKAVFAALVVTKFSALSPGLGKKQMSTPTRIASLKSPPPTPVITRMSTSPASKMRYPASPQPSNQTSDRRASLTSPTPTTSTQSSPTRRRQTITSPQPNRQQQTTQKKQTTSQTKPRQQPTSPPAAKARGPAFVTPLA